MVPLADREQIIRKIIAILKPIGVKRIALFGSFVGPNPSRARDIDILVTLAPPGERRPIGLRWFVLDQELESALGMPVDLITVDSLNPTIRRLIESEIEVIYDEAG